MVDKSIYKPRLKIKRLQVRNHRTREPAQQLEPQVFAQDIDREKQIIKACMDPDFADELDKIISHLSPDHFYQDTHQKIFRSIVKIRREGKFPEFLHIGEDLQRRGVANVEILKELGRIKEFVEAHIVNVDDYIKAIQDAFGKRKCAELANNLWKMSVDRKSTTGDLVEVARQSIEVIENTGIESIQRFEFIKAADLIDYIDPAQWVINGILEEKSFYYNYGPSGTYKTFVEMDRGLCIAAGIAYHGHAVKQGTVFYIAGEGQRGIYKRTLAWCIKHKVNIKDVPFYIGTFPAQLTVRESVEEIRRLIETMAAKSGDPALIIFDTLARNFGPGSENDTQDMNTAIHNLDVFRNYLCRSLIAHTGHKNRDEQRDQVLWIRRRIRLSE